MGLLGFRKKKVVDFTDKYRKQQEKIAQMRAEADESRSQSGLGFLGSLASGANLAREGEDEQINVFGDSEKKKKLAKRLLDMTEKLENLSNQIYHLQQRVELLEKKTGVGRDFE